MAEQTITVKALQRHTYHGQTYDVGDTYEIDAQDAESVEVQGKAAPLAPSARPYRTTEAHVPHKAVLTAPLKK